MDPLATFGPPPSAEDPVWDGDGTEFFEEVPIMDPPRPTTLDALFGCCVREPGDLTAVGLLADALAEDLPGEGETRRAVAASGAVAGGVRGRGVLEDHPRDATRAVRGGPVPRRPDFAAALLRESRQRFDLPGYTGDWRADGLRVVRNVTGGMTAAGVVAICLAVAGVRVRSKAAAERELLAYLTEAPRMRESQRV